MKPLSWKRFHGALCVGLAVAFLPVTGWSIETSNATTPATPTEPAAAPLAPAPPNTTTATKLSAAAREVVKLISSGVPADVVKTYVQNSANMFNLTPDGLIELHEIGVPNDIATAMLLRDNQLRANNMAAAQVYTQPPVVAQPPVTSPYATVPSQPYDESAAPDYSDYYNQLAPYGNWSYMPGYGYGWQPYYGLDYAYYPWGVLGWGAWNFLPGFGWCWFPRGHFHGDYGHYHAGFYNHYNNFNHYSNFSHFNNYNHFNTFNHGFNNHAFYGGHAMSGFHGGFAGGGARMAGGGMHGGGGFHGGGGGGHR